MTYSLASRRRAHIFALIFFLVGIGILIYMRYWWPGIMLVIGLPIAFNQYMLGRTYDMAISLFVFVGVFITVQFDIAWEILLPVLFTTGGLYIFFREFFGGTSETVAEEEEDLNHRIEEQKKHK